MKKYVELTESERAIDRFLHTVNPEDPASINAGLNLLNTIGAVQQGLAKYRLTAGQMSIDQLETEKHSSERMARHMIAAGKVKRHLCHAHAIVSGGHDEALDIRGLLAFLKLRIDDPDNGCWLPSNTASRPQSSYPRGVPHSRIHRWNYYFWLKTKLNMVRIKDIEALRSQLRLIENQLQVSTMPDFVMMKKKEGIA